MPRTESIGSVQHDVIKKADVTGLSVHEPFLFNGNKGSMLLMLPDQRLHNSRASPSAD